jgi:hypothetical protein
MLEFARLILFCAALLAGVAVAVSYLPDAAFGPAPIAGDWRR